MQAREEDVRMSVKQVRNRYKQHLTQKVDCVVMGAASHTQMCVQAARTAGVPEEAGHLCWLVQC